MLLIRRGEYYSGLNHFQHPPYFFHPEARPRWIWRPNKRTGWGWRWGGRLLPRRGTPRSCCRSTARPCPRCAARGPRSGCAWIPPSPGCSDPAPFFWEDKSCRVSQEDSSRLEKKFFLFKWLLNVTCFLIVLDMQTGLAITFGLNGTLPNGIVSLLYGYIFFLLTLLIWKTSRERMLSAEHSNLFSSPHFHWNSYHSDCV